MKTLKLLMSLALVALVATQCQKEELVDLIRDKGSKPEQSPPKGTFTVTVKNVSQTYEFFRIRGFQYTRRSRCSGSASTRKYLFCHFPCEHRT